jgi:triacylglycerol lipase
VAFSRWQAAALAVALLVCSGVPAYADDPNHPDDPTYNEDEYAAFYTPPDPLPPGEPGDLIRTEPSRLVLEPSGQLGAIMATGTRIMYRSIDSRGHPMAVTGTYFEPFNPWGWATSARRRASSIRASTSRRSWTSRSTTRS